MLAIAGGKGGVGKTTTALGVGVALAARRRNPVVVDADRDTPNLHLVADVDDGGIEALADGVSIDDASTVSRGYEGIRIIGSYAGGPVGRALRQLVTDSPVVVDTPAGGSRDAILPLRLADHAIVVTTPDPASVEDARKTARIARRVDTEVVAWIVNRSSTVPETLRGSVGDVPVIPVPASPDPPTDARRAYDDAVSGWVNA
ncbi:RecA-superfamily ATPase implicated in signal transduction, inactivated [Halanaeroarchaeum sp. HSR-CO]|uniref:MinD/ParA family ATP-binding protein n=1 Tax=Halanaeroarchaeum sp. HSR-CO TaxID=2866382 RepID=UPI00217E2BCD|nr:P-loop NTPase [Halanaeroarchaeum sp. HSR-CO]UWG48379.1 RecA-superfamily ATPase implicated in signal transduction, inactivated [Halanaeroarchaeum sp. HSR-CO]